MPTPTELDALRRAAAEDPYFTVHEVIECVSSDDEDAGEEDLPVSSRTSTLRRHHAEQRRLTAHEQRRSAAKEECDEATLSASASAARERGAEGADGGSGTVLLGSDK